MEKSRLVKEGVRHHPLDPLSADEIGAAVRVFRTYGRASDHMRFGSVRYSAAAVAAGHHLAPVSRPVVVEPMLPALVRCIVFFCALATPFVAALLTS